MYGMQARGTSRPSLLLVGQNPCTEESVPLRNGLPPPHSKLWSGWRPSGGGRGPSERGTAIAVYGRDGNAFTHLYRPGPWCRTGQLGGNSCPKECRCAVRSASRRRRRSSSEGRQSATERINGGQFHIAVELLPKCEERAPTAGEAAGHRAKRWKNSPKNTRLTIPERWAPPRSCPGRRTAPWRLSSGSRDVGSFRVY